MSYPVSAAFTAALLESHTVAAAAVVRTAQGAVVAATANAAAVATVPAGTPTLHLAGGSVDADRKSRSLRRCTATFNETGGLVPTGAATDVLVPYGNELSLWRGVTYTDATTELVPLGVFRISAVHAADQGEKFEITVDGYDRSRQIGRLKLTDYYQVAAGVTYDTAVAALLHDRWPSLDTSGFLPSVLTTPAVTVYSPGDDPWARALELAAAAGAKLWFDVTGACQFRPQPDPVGVPVAGTYLDGSLLTAVSRVWDDADAFNHVIVSGESTGTTTPVSASASDTTSGSPTWTGGAYGDIPDFVRSPQVTTTAQAQAMAAAQLLVTIGSLDAPAVETIPNPALDVDDVIQAQDTRASLNGWYVIDALTCPLSSAQAMRLTLRKVNRSA